MSYPHYNEIEGKGDVEWNKVGCELQRTRRQRGRPITDLELYNFFQVTMHCSESAGIWMPTTNVIVMLKERAHLLYALVTKKKFNLCIVIFKNIMRQLYQRKARTLALSSLLITEFGLGCKDLSLPTYLWSRELDILMMPKTLLSRVVTSSPTQTAPAPSARTTRYQYSRKVTPPT